MALTMRTRAWRPALVDEAAAALPPDGTAVEVGAGTGTNALALAAARPDGTVVAVDGDPAALRLASAKRGAGGVEWVEGLAQELPVTSGSVDVVLMSLVLHHLGDDDKRAALAEAARVLRGRGRLVIADWGRPGGPIPRAGFMAVRVLDGLDRTGASAHGRLPGLVEEAGFREVHLRRRVPTLWGTLELLTARRPS